MQSKLSPDRNFKLSMLLWNNSLFHYYFILETPWKRTILGIKSIFNSYFCHLKREHLLTKKSNSSKPPEKVHVQTQIANLKIVESTLIWKFMMISLVAMFDLKFKSPKVWKGIYYLFGMLP